MITWKLSLLCNKHINVVRFPLINVLYTLAYCPIHFLLLTKDRRFYRSNFPYIFSYMFYLPFDWSLPTWMCTDRSGLGRGGTAEITNRRLPSQHPSRKARTRCRNQPWPQAWWFHTLQTECHSSSRVNFSGRKISCKAQQPSVRNRWRKWDPVSFQTS